MGFVLTIISQLGKLNLALFAIAAAFVFALWRKHSGDQVDFLLSIVIASPLIAALLALPIMSWMKLILYDAPKAAALGGKHYLYFSQEVRMKFVKGYPWARLSDVCKILGVAAPEKIARRFSGLECDSLDTDHDWLSEAGVKRLAGMPIGPEAAKFGNWFEKDIAKPASKMRDRGTPTTA